MLFLNQSIRAYRFVSQGKTTIPGVDDGEMMAECDVSTERFSSDIVVSNVPRMAECR